MSTTDSFNEITQTWLGIVATQGESLKFRVVPITVHESRVIQSEKDRQSPLGQI